jgi:hypothetical protein
MSLMTGHVDDDRHRQWPPSINARAILNHCLTIGLAGCDDRVSVMAAHRPDVCGSKDREDHSRATGGKRFPSYPRQSSPHPISCDGGARHGRVVTNAVRSPVRPATRWMWVVSMDSARLIAGKMVVSQRGSIDVPVPGRAEDECTGTGCLYA